MTDSSLSERQKDELEALKAIYMEDVVDLRDGDAWKVDRPPEFRLTLKPQESMGTNQIVYVQLDMVIRCQLMYPSVVPEISLENPKGVSDGQVSALKKELDVLARQLVGEVMIMELAQHIQKFLHAYNKPPSLSFYEEMMCNKRKQEEIHEKEEQRKLVLLQQKEEQERQLIEDEILRRQEKLKEESKKRKQILEFDTCSSESSSPSAESMISCSPGEIYKHRAYSLEKSQKAQPVVSRQRGETLPCHQADNRRRSRSTPRREIDEGVNHQCKDHAGGIVVLAFNTKGDKTIHRGRCLGHGLQGSTVYVGIDTHSGELVTISEWVMNWCHIANCEKRKIETDPKTAAFCLKQIMSIEQELMSLLRLRHRNLIHCLAINYHQVPGKITVYLLMEYVGGMNLDVHLRDGHPVSVEALRLYTEGILLGLEYLHNHSVVHKDLRASSVFVDTNGQVRLGDYSINKRLSDMYQSMEQSGSGVCFHDNGSPVLGRGGKKGDIYQLGILLLSLIQGEKVTEILPEVPVNLSPHLSDFLTKCLIRDDRHRLSASQLLEHSFLSEPIPGLIFTQTPHSEKSQQVKVDDNLENSEEEELPYIMPFEASGKSRLTNEFVVLKCLGKGGFGDVLKVRNKLDGRSYAIKRIPLNPKSQHFNKKITREVKLLSRLNHENVVRYYNSWIETSDEVAETESSSLSSNMPRNEIREREKQVLSLSTPACRNSLGLTDSIEQFAPQTAEDPTEWSVSHDHSGNLADLDIGSDSDDDELDESDVFGLSFLTKPDSANSIIFDCSVDEFCFPTVSDSGDAKIDERKVDNETDFTVEVLKLQYLYIQMEYCEKSTLRNCIDAGLHKDMDRVWRLFREIIEGLVHIHEQGMIHRDLKPVNIFLDSNDQVKIGDFGLATTDVITKNSQLDISLQAISATDIHYSSSHSGSVEDSILTGQVGTAMYVSPEVMAGGKDKGSYDQKVDIYSLGIILFEMTYKPLPIGMERLKILGNLRSKEIHFPDDFDHKSLVRQGRLVHMLLNHDPTKRLTSKELLQSELLPPPQMEVAELNEILRSTISDPQSKSYRRMMDSLFSQSVRPDYDLLYETDIFKGTFSSKVSIVSQFVSGVMEKVFQRHGAIKVTSPLFMPKSENYENTDQCVCFVDHSGRLVSLPFDLRVPFARYVCKMNIHHLKRYSIERVYREKHVYGLLFRELIECAFDIVSSTQGSLIPDAESLVVVQEIINDFPPLQQRNYYVRMNHASLQKAILLHCGIAEERHDDALRAVAKMKLTGKSMMQLPVPEFLSELAWSLLLPYVEIENTYSKVFSFLRCITKTKGQAATLAKQGLHEIGAVMKNAELMGLKLPVLISLGLVYNTRQYSGILYHVVFDIKKKKRTIPNILAAGGRYDKLLKELSYPVACSTTAVGVSVSFREIINAVLEQEEYRPLCAHDIFICTIGHEPMLKERLSIVKDLWAAGLRADMLHDTLQSLEEIQNYCRSAGIPQLVILKDSDTGSVKVRSIDKEKVTEKKVMTAELVEFLQQRCQSNKM